MRQIVKRHNVRGKGEEREGWWGFGKAEAQAGEAGEKEGRKKKDK